MTGSRLLKVPSLPRALSCICSLRVGLDNYYRRTFCARLIKHVLQFRIYGVRWLQLKNIQLCFIRKPFSYENIYLVVALYDLYVNRRLFDQELCAADLAVLFVLVSKIETLDSCFHEANLEWNFFKNGNNELRGFWDVVSFHTITCIVYCKPPNTGSK